MLSSLLLDITPWYTEEVLRAMSGHWYICLTCTPHASMVGWIIREPGTKAIAGAQTRHAGHACCVQRPCSDRAFTRARLGVRANGSWTSSPGFSAQGVLTHLQMLLLGAAGGQPQHSFVEAADERPGAGVRQQQHAAGQHLHDRLCMNELQQAAWRLAPLQVPPAKHDLRPNTASCRV